MSPAKNLTLRVDEGETVLGESGVLSGSNELPDLILSPSRNLINSWGLSLSLVFKITWGEVQQPTCSDTLIVQIFRRLTNGIKARCTSAISVTCSSVRKWVKEKKSSGKGTLVFWLKNVWHEIRKINRGNFKELSFELLWTIYLPLAVFISRFGPQKISRFQANMHRHRMRHSGVKPYECRYCKKRFFRKDQVCHTPLLS